MKLPRYFLPINSHRFLPYQSLYQNNNNKQAIVLVELTNDLTISKSTTKSAQENEARIEMHETTARGLTNSDDSLLKLVALDT